MTEEGYSAFSNKELSMGKRRTINPDHIRARNVPDPETEVVAARLQELLSPLVYNQLGY